MYNFFTMLLLVAESFHPMSNSSPPPALLFSMYKNRKEEARYVLTNKHNKTDAKNSP